MADQNDSFDISAAFTDLPLNEEVAKLDSKVKKRAEKRAKEDREKQREINREKRKSKKEQRELNKKRKRGEIPIDDDEETPSPEGDTSAKDNKTKKTKEKSSEFGIWVGNLSFQTSPEDVLKHFTQCGPVVRMRCPGGQRRNKNKGFAYIFFGNAEHMEKALELNEQELDGRALLIKKADDFQRKDGLAPEEPSKGKKTPLKQKNPPCATLFLGNLPFTATRESVQEQFKIFGGMYKVRLATFEDSGKCKGFGYVDFCELDSAIKAIRAPDKHIIDGRKIRVEYASEDAYNRGRPWILRERERQKAEQAASATDGSSNGAEKAAVVDQNQAVPERRHKKRRSEENEDGSASEKRRKTKGSSGRVAPGKALVEAQRQRPTVQEFKGTKITFGDD
ncbi:hypothetical protein BX666DRAFT_1906664 [Dichotomocladium elegans]|nr:hypothetical protein BX666DRAFT_1906664 [Dichotomocladium elegans]